MDTAAWGALHDRVSAALPTMPLADVGGVARLVISGPVVGVRIEGAGDAGVAVATLTVQTSDVLNGPTAATSEGRLGPAEARALVDHDQAGCVVVEGPGAWIETSWDRPVDALAVLVESAPSRRPGVMVRARVCVLRPDGVREIVVDGAEATEAARTDILSRTQEEFAADDARAASLLQAAFECCVGEYWRARTTVNAIRPRVRGAALASFKGMLNPDLLAARGLEWTSHGPVRSFRFWTEDQKAAYTRQAVDLTEALSELTPHVCFGFGAALAAVRDGAMIAHDDDLDVIVAFEPHEAPDLPAGLELVESHLRSRGFIVAGEFFAHRHVRREGEKNVDVFVGLFEGDAVSWYPGPRNALTRSDVFPASTAQFYGSTVPLPRDPEAYLTAQYGPRWRSPDPDFAHSWGRARYRDLRPAKPPAAPPGRWVRWRRRAGAVKRRLSRLLSRPRA